MAAQEKTPLPRRVARSAKDIARASLSGVAYELKDPRTAKQAGSSSQTTAAHRQDDGSQIGEAPKSRPALYARENSFRNQANASALRAAEEDFDQFQGRDPRRDEWLSSELSTCFKIDPETGTYQDGSYLGLQNEPHAAHSHTSGATAKYGSTDTINSKCSGSDTSAKNDTKRESKANHARAAAARRLEQIGAQIQRNLALQGSLQRNSNDQAHLLPTLTMDVQHDSAQQAPNQQSRTPQPSHIESMSDPHQIFEQPQHRQTPNLDREQDKSQRPFHCPHYACHHNLKLYLSSSLSSSRKMCVHTGCNERLETQDAWSQHIALPHHDLQG